MQTPENPTEIIEQARIENAELVERMERDIAGQMSREKFIAKWGSDQLTQAFIDQYDEGTRIGQWK